MANNVSQHTFVKGMVSDLELGMKNNESYDYAENFRHTSDESASIGAIINIKGFEKFTTDGDLDSRLTLVSHCVIRDKLYLLFTSRPSAGGSDSIIRFDIDSENKSLSNMVTLYAGGVLGLSLSKNTDCIGIYEAVDNIKLYWATEGENLKVANVSSYLTSDGLTKSGTNTWINYGRFDIVTAVTLKPIVLNGLVSGSLTTGRVQYAYNLYKEHIQESIVSSLSLPINLFYDSLSAPSTVDIKGDSEVVNTGKGVSLSISIDSIDSTYFDYLRLYRIHYSEYGQVPTITIVGDYYIANSTSSTVTDSGQVGLGELTVEEFAILSTLYKGKTLTVKDNRLFAANIEEGVFDIDFDARAYRFNSSRLADLYAGYGYGTAQYIINGYSPSLWDTIPETAACVTNYNDVSKDNNSAYEYVYQADGSTIGGEGPNIKYTFSTSTIAKLDGTTTIANPRTYSSITDTTYETLDQTSPKLTKNFTGYQRGEIYRFGIVFFNELGQRSKVKWIGDIRFPMFSSTLVYNRITLNSVSDVTSCVIGLSLTLKDGVLPTSAVGWELVRVQRNLSDRSIITTGVVSATNDFNEIGWTYATFKLGIPGVYQYSMGLLGAKNVLNYDVLSFYSPEELFQGRSDIKIGDYMDIMGVVKDSVTYTEDGAYYPTVSSTSRTNSIKYKTAFNYDNTNIRHRFVIENNGFYDSVNNPVQSYTYSKAVSGTYAHVCMLDNTASNNIYCQRAPSGSILQVDTSISTAVSNLAIQNFDLPYVYIKRNNTSRYGGYLYESRESNEYISCGDISTAVTNVVYYGGDTFINYFDYLHTIYEDYNYITNSAISASYRNNINMIFPCESGLNISLRYDKHMATQYPSEYSHLMEETAGDKLVGGIVLYTQPTDLYLYNTVYSQEQNISVNFALNNVDANTTYDSRIIYSDKKVYNESVDSWTKFRVNNFLDVESTFGKIEVIRNFRNDIYFWQENSFGLTPVNERSLLSDNNPGALSLGIANVMSRYVYISKDYGCKDLLSLCSTNSGLYWIDRNRKTIIRYNGEQLEDLAKSKGFKVITSNILSENTSVDAFTFNTVYNKDYNEVLIKLTPGKVLIYNEYIDVASCIMTYTPEYIMDVKGIVTTYSWVGTGYPNLFGHDKTYNFGRFTSSISQPSTITIVDTDNYSYTKVYDNILYFSYSKDSSGITNNTDTFNNVTFSNDFQTTGQYSFVLGTTLQKRERGYEFAVPRNIVIQNGTTNIDITDPLNQDSTRLFKERMRDKYIKSEFIYNNSNYLFTLPYIHYKYRQSKR
jgi:hypothetical protein